jgi:hypothetical protein
MAPLSISDKNVAINSTKGLLWEEAPRFIL